MTSHDLFASTDRPIKVDADHFLIRFLVPVLALGVTALMHIAGMSAVGQWLDEGISAECVVIPLDVLVLAASGIGIEAVLKRVLPSMRSALLTPEALILRDGRRKPVQTTRIDWERTVNARAWRFTVHRRTRVPKGWFCMAVQLVQDETEAILYTFMPTDQAEKVPGYDNFVRLRPRKETESNTDLSAVAEQRRLLRLEDARWRDGAELHRDDFRAVLAVLAQHVPGWIS